MNKRLSIAYKINLKLEKIDDLLTKIAAFKELLRDEVNELESILESLDRGTDEIECGLSDIRSGIDSLSEYL